MLNSSARSTFNHGTFGMTDNQHESAAEVSGIEASVQEQIDLLQDELRSLNEELELHRMRDHLLNNQMIRLDEELRLAAKIQRDFLPKSLPEVGRVRFNALFRPAGYVSGDLYDVMRLDENHVGFYIADAVGHGTPAALLTMFLKHALVTKEITDDGYRLLEPTQTMQKLNEALLEQHLSQSVFATAIYGFINTQTLELKFSCGGHPNPVVLSPDGQLRQLAASGGLLGIFPDEQYSGGHAQLAPGERLVLFSDGVEMSFTDERTLDTERWRSALTQHAGMATDKLLSNLSSQIDATTGSIEAKDDLTIVVVEAI